MNLCSVKVFANGEQMIFKIPITKKQALKSEVKRTVFEYPKTGIESMFIQLTSRKGIKIFPDQEEADISMNLQQRAYEKGMAPKVFFNHIFTCSLSNLHKFDKNNEVFISKDGVPFKDDEKRLKLGYFYFTEVATCPIDHLMNYDKEMQRLEKIAPTISYKGRCLGEDMHWKNLGELRGRMVLIDFGRHSTFPSDS